MTKKPTDIKEQLLDELMLIAFKIKTEYAKEERERDERKDKIKIITINKGANNEQRTNRK